MNDETIFEEARRIPSVEERTAYLDRACTGNQALKKRVEALLAANDRPDSLLDAPLMSEETSAFPTSVQQPGQSIGAYKLLQKVGEGGFGVVYLAEQEKPVSRRVALKVIKPGMDTRQVIARFEAERQALAMMDHPNIAKVLDADMTESGRPYFVMELVKGLPITKFCDEQELSARERLELFIPVCNAIQHAHQKGVIHRDVKPSNILVSLYDGTPIPKVIDFGVAKAIQHRLTDKTVFTQFGQVVGTVEYMSPEQAEMNQLDIDTRTDIYSLGAVLYELLTGATPLNREKLRSAAFDEMLRIIREIEPVRPSHRISSSQDVVSISRQRRSEPSKLATAVAGELDWITMKALDKQRSRRYETANGLARDIERFLSNEPVEACPPSATYRFRKLARKYRRGLAIATAFLVLLAAATLISGIQWQRNASLASRETIARQRAERSRTETQSMLDRALVAESTATNALSQARVSEAEAQRNLYIARMQQIQLEWERNRIGRVRQLLRGYESPADSTEDLRGWEWFYWNRMTHLDLRTLPHDAGVQQIAFSPDSSMIASGDANGVLRLWRVAKGELLSSVAAHPGGITAVAFLADNTTVVTGGADNSIRVWNADPLRSSQLIQLPAQPTGIAVSHDGRFVAVGCRDGDLNRPTERLVFSSEPFEIAYPLAHDTGVSSVAFSHDDRRLICAGYPHVEEWNLQDKTLTTHDFDVVPTQSNRDWYEIAFAAVSSRDSLLATFKFKDSAIRISHGDTFTEKRSLLAHVGAVNDGMFNRDGTRFLSAGEDQAIRVWDVGTGDLLRTYRGHAGRITSLALSPDGLRVASASDDRTVKIWDSHTNLDLRQVIARTVGHYLPPTIVGNDRFVVVRMRHDDLDGKRYARLIDLKTHRHVGDFGGHSSWVFSCDVSSDGKLIATGGDRDVLISDIESKRQRLRLELPGLPMGLHFNPVADAITVEVRRIDGPSRDSTYAMVYDVSTGQLLFETETLSRVDINPVNGQIAFVTKQAQLRIVDPRTRETTVSWPAPTEGRLRFSQSGKLLACHLENGEITVWDARDGVELHRFQNTGTLLGFDRAELRLLFATDSGVEVRDLHSGDLVCTTHPSSKYVGTRFSSISADGNSLVIGDFRWLGMLEIREPTPETEVQREAQALVASLLRYPLQEPPAAPIRRSELLMQIEDFQSVSREVKDQAALLVRDTYTRYEESEQFQEAAFDMLKNQHLSEAETKLAAEWAQRAYEIGERNFGATTATLGEALYRIGEYEKAEQLLREAIEEFREEKNYDAVCAVQASLAMAQFKLGDHLSARLTLALARDPAFNDITIPFVKDRLRRAIRLIEPQNPGANLMDRGQNFARVRQWDEAIHAFEDAEQHLVGVMRSLCLYRQAMAYIAAGNSAGHIRVCNVLRDEFDLETDERAARWYVAASVTNPAYTDWSTVEEVSAAHDLFSKFRVAALYRAGRYEEALKMASSDDRGWALGYAAMAQFQLRNGRAARKLFLQLDSWIGGFAPGRLRRFTSWTSELDNRLLLDEAQSLIFSTASSVAAEGMQYGDIRHWLYLGPLPTRERELFVAALERQQVPNESSLRPRLGEQLSVEGTQYQWESLIADGPYHFLPASEQCAAYLASYVVADRPFERVLLRVGSDDAARIYLNGKTVYEFAEGRSLERGSDEGRSNDRLAPGCQHNRFQVGQSSPRLGIRCPDC